MNLSKNTHCPTTLSIGIPFVLLYSIIRRYFCFIQKQTLDQVNAIKKHIQKIQTIDKIPVVVVLTKITARQRQNMVDAGIPFIVESKQCYLPFIGTVFTEKCDAEVGSVNTLIPSAQMLLFYYIYRNQRELYANEAVEALDVSAMTITRAVRQLEQTGFMHTYKNGVRKILSSEYTGKELFEKIKGYLFCPISQKKYIPKEMVDGSLLISGDQALSLHSMLNPPKMNCYATGDNIKWRNCSDELIDDSQQVELQLWKYDPRLLAMGSGSTVDILSLAMCYIDDPDERVEEAVSEMLEEYWRNTNG
jgi:DNA-binding MarR family transcriptional regulator